MCVKDEIVSFHNLYRATNKCRKNVRWKDSVAHFTNHQLASVYKLRKSILEGTYKISPYSRFVISEPKRREITSTRFKDRVFQRSLCDNYLYGEITKGFIPSNFACQKKKGTDRAREYLEWMLKQFYRENGTDGYWLKVDIKDYFGSTKHDTAKRAIGKRVEDGWSKSQVDGIVDSFDNHGDFSKGIGLGSQVSQLIQLAVLDDVDHLIDGELGCRFYLRYMDDMVILSKSKEELESILEEIKRSLQSVGLAVSPKKTFIAKITQPITFLGFSFMLHESGRVTLRLPKRNVKDEKRKLRKLVMRLNRADFEECYKSWRAHAKKSDSRGRMLKMDKYKGELMKYISLKEQTAEAVKNVELVQNVTKGDNAVSSEIRAEGYSIYEENAILRKALASLISLLKYEGKSQFADFLEYNAKVEAIKAEVKANQNRELK